MRKDTEFNRALSCIVFNNDGEINELIGIIGEDVYFNCLEIGYIKVDGDRWECKPWVKNFLKKRNIPYKRIFRKHWKELIMNSSYERVERESFWWKLRHWYMFRVEIYYVD